MTTLGTIDGTGTLIVNGEDICDVSYTLTIIQSRGMKYADGYITGDPEVLLTTFEARITQLRLQSGDIVEAMIVKFGYADNATIKINGPVPGY
jgi:hypothetical protein